MGAPTVYRWDDGNAPVARGERRSLCDILYACLVTGYGTKPGAGWTREYVNATFDKAVFRAGSGNRFFLQVDGNTAANTYTPKIQAFEAMTSESDGLLPFYASVHTLLTSNAANTTARPWILIADDRFFYFLCWNSITATPTTSDNTVSGMYFGDCVPIHADDAFASCLFAGTYGFANQSVIASSGLGGVYDPKFPRKYSGVAGSYVSAQVHNGGPCTAGIPGYPGVSMAYTAGDPIFYARPFVTDGAAFTIRGWLPGYYYPCQTHPFSQFQQLSLDGKNFLALKTTIANTSLGSYMISLDDWRV